jgi:protein-S-isoprenylcysteine O-methyltransferase Ste14
MLLMSYSLLAYIVGLGVLGGFVLFVGAWDFLPWHIDSRAPASLLQGVVVNLGLLLAFGLQHSLMARPGFKRWLTQSLPAAAERSTYVLLSAFMIALICAFWQPLPGMAWRVEYPLPRWLLVGGYVLGWGMAVWSTFLVDHFELFGLHQAWRHLRKLAAPAPVFREVSLYRVVRHPMQLGVLIGLWSTPEMSSGHLMLALGMTLYVLVGLYYEERDLLAELGGDYADYRERVPQLLPRPRPRR